MPEDVGGTPFPDGREPDDDHDRGVSDEEFASVVFDEAFVKAARVHEPSAVERLLAAAQARAEASEAEARARSGADRYDDTPGPEGAGYGRYRHEDDTEPDDAHPLDGHHGLYGRQVRWHRPVAWVLAVVMGIGMVALAFAAVYRGGSSGTRDRVPAPASTGLEQGSAAAPSVPSASSRPAVSAAPRSP
ncbi:hypothetical protein NX794_09740 [Streptomyces sp. LP11]|uniref:Uncharacterized protein n=1 Tax=Streptomyces pyxinicus TaxID=2970331 RepID=A0ABT2AZ16_9ACTN|nr:hypothetical protein [Streptomyces sp. LP11]MCS0601507.1 hypothetical protein [Streptomyces sp. LP11]